MNICTTLCLTVCSMALMSGCGDTSQSGSTTPAGAQPSQSMLPSNLNELSVPDPSFVSTQQKDEQPFKANVYIYNSLLPKPVSPVELTDSAYFMTLQSYLHWKENQKILNIPGSAPHSANLTDALVKIPNADSNNPILIDVWGESSQNKGSFTLTDSATFSTIDVLDADLTMSRSGNLTALAMRFENANVSVNPNGKMITHALYVDKKSVINNGRNITYVSDNLNQFGMTMNQLNVHKHKRFPWATEGEFMIAGRVDQLSVTPGITLYTQGNAANFGSIEHQGGTIELTSSAPFKTSNYFVSSPGGNINVIWDTPSTIPLMQTDYATINNIVSVTLSELNGSIQPGDSLVLIESKGGSLTSFKPGIQTFAATFDLTNHTDEVTRVNRLTLTLTKKGLAATGLSHTETAIAHQILSHDDAQGRLSVALLDIATAQKALHDITQGTHLSAIRSHPLSFNGLRYGDQFASDSGIIQTCDETGDETQITTGLNIIPDARLGVSLTQPFIAHQNPKSKIGGIHGQYKQLGVDGFSSFDGKLNGASLGIYLGNKRDGYAALSISTQNQVRHGTSNTVFGHLSVDALNETHVFCNLTLKKKIENIDISTQFFTEMYAVRSSYSAKLNATTISTPKEVLPLTYGVQLQTTCSYTFGYFAAGYGLISDSCGYSSNISLQMHIHL